MANLYVSVRDGGKTDEEGFGRLLNKLAGTQNSGVVTPADFVVSEHGTPDMSVDVTVGDLVIPYSGYQYHGYSKALQTVEINDADPSNPRIDRIVAYVDRDVVDNTNPNNPEALVLIAVPGNPAGSPVRPSDSDVQTAVGAGNPFIDLADVRVEALATSIVNAKITDKRASFVLGANSKFGFFIQDLAFVSNDLSWNPIATQRQTIRGIKVYARTAPTGANLIIRIWNVTQGVAVGTVSIAAGGQTGSTTSLTNANIADGDVLRVDVTQVGSTVPGSNISVVAY